MKSLFFKISCIFLLTFLPFKLLSQAKINVKIDDIDDTVLYICDKIHYGIDYNTLHNEYIESILNEDKNHFSSSDYKSLKNKLDEFFDIYMSSYPPEYICEKIDDILNKMKETKTRDYILWHLYSKYFRPEITENELVYIHLADNYFSRLEVENLTENIRNRIVERADILRKIAIGQKAPTLSYTDEKGDTIDLYDTESKYTVLFFYKPDCQKCIRDKEILETTINKYKDLSVLTININEDNYKNVDENIVNQYDITTTPTIYLLDIDKKIIAKHIKAEEIELHITNK